MTHALRGGAILALMLGTAFAWQGGPVTASASCSARAHDAAATALHRNVKWTYAPRAYAHFTATFVSSRARVVCDDAFVGLNVRDRGETLYAGRDAEGNYVTGP